MDHTILQFIQSEMQHAILDPIFLFLTKIGTAGIIWILVALVLLLQKPHRETGVMVLVALLFGVVFGEILLKPMIARLRPFQTYEAFTTILHETKGFSFPSGHTTSSFAAAGVLIHHFRSKGWIFMVLAVGVAFSRLYYLVHYPSDIIGGVLLGLFCAGLVVGGASALDRRKPQEEPYKNL
jgi:undecaprenyl-diphosphatase